MKENSKQRSGTNTTVTIALPKELLKLVDEAAADEQRNRSNYIVYHITRAVKKTKNDHKDMRGA